MMKALVVAAMLGVASASCPNACSGHGTCNTYDQCTCFLEAGSDDFNGVSNLAEWTGADCSLRTCPRGTSWISADGSCEHSAEQECSDQGVCDRATGLCTCFDGFTGSACQRTECPNDCSGHGTCRSNKDFAYDWAVSKSNELDGTSNDINSFEGTYLASYDDAWDSGMQYGCKCDDGYRGADCSLVECPSSYDPMDDKCVKVTTDEDTGVVTEPTTSEIDDFQLQYDVATGSSAWNVAYASETSNNIYHLSDGVLYSCYGGQAGQDCSGRGICDYTSGECSCFSGYAGTACEDVSELS